MGHPFVLHLSTIDPHVRKRSTARPTLAQAFGRAPAPALDVAQERAPAAGLERALCAPAEPGPGAEASVPYAELDRLRKENEALERVVVILSRSVHNAGP